VLDPPGQKSAGRGVVASEQPGDGGVLRPPHRGIAAPLDEVRVPDQRAAEAPRVAKLVPLATTSQLPMVPSRSEEVPRNKLHRRPFRIATSVMPP
jgi:hypothetical protein